MTLQYFGVRGVGALPLDYVHHIFHTDCPEIKSEKPEPTVDANVYGIFQRKTKLKRRKLKPRV